MNGLSDGIAELLPSSDSVRQIRSIGFSEERRLAAQLDDIAASAWPMGCTTDLSTTDIVLDDQCLVLEAEKKLGIVAGLAAILHGSFGGF
ncbi:hypothetical protein [Yoonia sp. F2084L]|uniref:hypothetical protein n=1 Tax=Yoonia sp. F2084L TaxID=2926419 RepID=UPI001FF28C45|nr:hypothetical protein [Yoonia sp. F2084L]